MAKAEFEKYIRLFQPVMLGMKELFGDRAEFILHDLSKPESSVALVVGEVTSRQVGAPTTNVVIDALKKHGDAAPDMLGYRSLSRDGRVLKSSTIFIRSDEGRIVGCLCYNVDLTEYTMVENIFKSICTITPIEEEKNGGDSEIFAQDVSEVVEDIIHYEISHVGKPVPMMTRADKLQLVSTLDNKGVFDVKGTPELMAQLLGSSVFTIYNYLKEIRKGNKN